MQANKKVAAIIGVSIVLTSVLIASAFLFNCHINITPSYPIGLYQEIPTKEIIKGDLVLFCPPKKEIFTYGLSKGFYPSGKCESGSIPFIKKVAALEGDIVLIDKFVYVNGEKQNNSDVKSNFPYHSKGGKITKNCVLLLSDYNKRSFDGRYFGELNKNVIIARIKPIFTLN